MKFIREARTEAEAAMAAVPMWGIGDATYIDRRQKAGAWAAAQVLRLAPVDALVFLAGATVPAGAAPVEYALRLAACDLMREVV
ncbi:MAG: hypothetical protein VW405_13275 [Rhodospirillaceae bacterium]